MSKRITPRQKAEVIALVEAGFSKSACARKVGISLSSVKRISTDPTIKPGRNHAELVAQATEALHNALSSDSAKRQLASLMVDDLAIAAGLRDHISSLLERIEGLPVSNLKDAGAKARTLAAIATANKLNSDNLRQVIGLAAPQIEVDELPVLEVREMLPEEVKAIRDKQNRDAVKMGLASTEDECTPA